METTREARSARRNRPSEILSLWMDVRQSVTSSGFTKRGGRCSVLAQGFLEFGFYMGDRGPTFIIYVFARRSMSAKFFCSGSVIVIMPAITRSHNRRTTGIIWCAGMSGTSGVGHTPLTHWVTEVPANALIPMQQRKCCETGLAMFERDAALNIWKDVTRRIYSCRRCAGPQMWEEASCNSRTIEQVR